MENSALISEPAHVAAVILDIVAGVFWLSERQKLKGFFVILPAVIWVYFVPTILATAGVITTTSPIYSFASAYLLPFALFILTLSVDVRGILSLGFKPLAMMLVGTAGIAIGAGISFTITQPYLPADAWQSFAALSASWIGGSTNMVAIQQGLLAPESMLGPIIVVDTVVGYGWMGILLALVGQQARFDRWTRADRTAIDALIARVEAAGDHRRPTEVPHITMIMALGALAAVGAKELGDALPVIGDPVIISANSWKLLIVVTAGMLLSFTRLREVENVGSPAIGYMALYVLLASIGAQADIAKLMEAPALFVAGLIIIAVHVSMLIIAAKWMRAPMFLMAIGSMANIGGSASAPVVAGVFARPLMPVGLLLAIFGYILGIYVSFGIADMLASIAGL